MLIGELAKALDVTPKTLRHYEKVGLIDAPRRAPNGYRIYLDEAAARVRMVVMLRKLDLSIHAVAELLDGDDDGRTLRQRLMGQLDEQIGEHELQIAVHQGQREDLQARYEALLSTPASRSDNCICGALLQRCSCARG